MKKDRPYTQKDVDLSLAKFERLKMKIWLKIATGTIKEGCAADMYLEKEGALKRFEAQYMHYTERFGEYRLKPIIELYKTYYGKVPNGFSKTV